MLARAVAILLLASLLAPLRLHADTVSEIRRQTLPAQNSQRRLIGLSAFPDDRLATLSRPSAFSASQMQNLTRRSEFGGQETRTLDSASEFSPDVRRRLNAQSEAGPDDLGRLLKASQFSSDGALRRLSDPDAVRRHVDRASRFTADEIRRVLRASGSPEVLRSLAQAAQPSPQMFQSLRRHSLPSPPRGL